MHSDGARAAEHSIPNRDGAGPSPAVTATPAPLTDVDLDAIEARANAATPGPWSWDGEFVRDRDDLIVADLHDDRATGFEIAVSRGAEFIAAARMDVPRLVAEVRRLRAADGRLRRLDLDLLTIRDGLVREQRERAEKAEAEAARLRAALEIAPEDCGRIVHEKWCRTQREQLYHGPADPCTAGAVTLPTPEGPMRGLVTPCNVHGRCAVFDADLVPWSDLPEEKKARWSSPVGAGAVVLAELRRRAGLAS